MNATIKDVAKAAGVSVATVSRVLNNSANVSDLTEKRVKSAIEALGYRPNFLGRNLRKCETNVILAIIPSTEHTFYSEILSGMQIKAGELGYDILIACSNSDSQTELRLLNMLSSRTVDAAVLLGTRLDAEVLNSLNEQYCIALCCERIPDSNVLTITVDDESAGYDAVSYLINKGHRKIAMISTTGVAYSSTDREKGYKRALEENNIEINENYIFRGTYDYNDGKEAVKQFMSLDDKPTAIFAISDLLAAGAISEISAMGLKTGEDIAVMGFDNISISEMFIPSISTVEQPCQSIGRTVLEMVVDNLQNPNKNNGHHSVSHRLVPRQSTGD